MNSKRFIFLSRKSSSVCVLNYSTFGEHSDSCFSLYSASPLKVTNANSMVNVSDTAYMQTQAIHPQPMCIYELFSPHWVSKCSFGFFLYAGVAYINMWVNTRTCMVVYHPQKYSHIMSTCYINPDCFVDFSSSVLSTTPIFACIVKSYVTDGDCVVRVTKMCSIFCPVDHWDRITTHNASHHKCGVQWNRLILEARVNFGWNLRKDEKHTCSELTVIYIMGLLN